MAESENQLELKKRARRRLVGAVALALTAAIVLPMVMDHEPKPLTQDIQIRIPSQDAANTSRPVASRPGPAETDAARAKPVPEAEATKPVKPVEPDAVRTPSPPSVKADVKPAPNTEKSDAKPEAKPLPKRETPPDAKDTNEPRAEREAKVEAILSGNQSPASAGQFAVQLGAFGDPANVAKVRTRVKATGFNSYTEVLQGPKGNQTRVRAGPFASREAAEHAAAKLKHAGLAGVVAPK
jgi:DedD protein